MGLTRLQISRHEGTYRVKAIKTRLGLKETADSKERASNVSMAKFDAPLVAN